MFTGIYGFEGGIAGLPFLGIITGAIVAYIIYVLYNIYYLAPKFARMKFNVPPEEFLRLSCFAGVFIPVSLFVFGWSARRSVHWMVPVVGAGLFVPGLLTPSVFVAGEVVVSTTCTRPFYTAPSTYTMVSSSCKLHERQRDRVWS